MIALLETVERVLRVVHHGHVYETVFTPERIPGDTLQLLHDGLVSLYKAALEVIAFSGERLDKGTPAQIAATVLHPDKLSDLFSNLESRESEIAQTVQACESQRSADADAALMDQLHKIHPAMAQINQRLDDCFMHLKEQESLELLEWMSKVFYKNHHSRVQENRTPNTCDWLLRNQRYCEWQTSMNSSVAWLWGSRTSNKMIVLCSIDAKRR
jgi:hypothetical protein